MSRRTRASLRETGDEEEAEKMKGSVWKRSRGELLRINSYESATSAMANYASGSAGRLRVFLELANFMTIFYAA
jgi:hypothetical protein